MSRGELIERLITFICFFALGSVWGASWQHWHMKQSPADVVRGVEEIK